jgi:hypothetical protein
MEKSIIINRKKSVSIKATLLLFFALSLFGFYLYLYYGKPVWLTSGIPFFLVVIAYLIMPILLFAFIFYFRSIFNHKPVLIVNENGIHEQMRYRSLGMIMWTDIEKISVQPYMDKTYLIHIYLINPDVYLKKKPLFKFKRFNYGHVIISTLYFKKDFQEVMQIINYHFEKNQVAYNE